MSGTPVSPLRVVVADDQRAIREALGMVLDSQADLHVVGLASDGAEAVELAARHDAHVVLMDLQMPGTDGVAATRRLAAEQPQVKVVVLTTFADDATITDALAAGAIGYLTKDAGHHEIALAVRSAAAGQTVLDPAVHASLLRNVLRDVPDGPRSSEPPGELPDHLTPREADILRAIAAGLTNTDIAHDLYISEPTVKSHINHLFRKINVRNRAQAVRYAYDHGFNPPN
jgi:DNA-binding NarL/FixJ family response regulator